MHASKTKNTHSVSEKKFTTACKDTVDIYDEANHFIMKYDYYIKKMSRREFQKKHQ
jgi:hypothetical protein